MRRKYLFIEFLGKNLKFATHHLTSSNAEIKWRAEQCKNDSYPYKIINRHDHSIVDKWHPDGNDCKACKDSLWW